MLSVYLPLLNVANKFSTHHVVSPELVTIWVSLRKRQQDKYPAEESRQILRGLLVEFSQFIKNLDSSDSWLITWPLRKKADRAYAEFWDFNRTKGKPLCLEKQACIRGLEN